MSLDPTRFRVDTFSSGIPGNAGYTCSVRVSDSHTGLCAEVVGDSQLKAREQALQALQAKIAEVEK